MKNKEDSNIELFPYVLARIAGEPFETLEGLNITRTYGMFAEIQKINIEIAKLNDNICNALYSLIPDITDNKIQNSLVKIKRDIHNLREIDAGQAEILGKYACDTVIKDLNELEEQKLKKNELLKRSEAVYNEEINAARSKLQHIILKDNFKNGLLISSENLLKRAESYSGKNIKDLNKDDLRTEQSLIKYISRMCAKTSPFSTFTNLGICDLNDSGGNRLLTDSGFKEGSFNSHVRLNGALFLYLKGLLFKNQKIAKWFLLRPNPTIKIREGEYVFLTNFDNIESFQKLEVNPVIDVLLQIIREKKEGILFNSLIETVLHNGYIDADEEELGNYILTLIDYGLIEYNLNVSGIDPDWDIKLSAGLKETGIKYALAGELSYTLVKMRELAVQYGNAAHYERKRILNESHEMFKNICMKLHKDAGLPEEEWLEKPLIPESSKKDDKTAEPAIAESEKAESEKAESEKAEADKNETEKAENEEFKTRFRTKFNFKPQQIYYEDTSVDCSLSLNDVKLKAILNAYNQIINAVRLMEINREELIKMTHFFLLKYGAEGNINILSFYEEFYKEFKKPEADYLEFIKRMKNNEKTINGNIGNNEGKVENNEGKVIAYNSENINDTDKNEASGKENSMPDEGSQNILKDPAENISALKEHREMINKWIEEFSRTFGNLDANSETADIKASHFPVNNYNINNPRPSSHGVFLQFFTESGSGGSIKHMAVINSTPPGFGKFFSRFLQLFERKITDAVIQNNISFCNDEIFAENCDYSHFNANIHPPLMPYEVWLPGSQNGLSPDKQIMVTDINIFFDKADNCLKLLHNKLGKIIYVFDLGFQSTMARSKLFQILSIFSVAENIYPNTLISRLNNSGPGSPAMMNIARQDKIITRPRIVYEDCIVLQRKQWLVPFKAIPFKLGRETDHGYFIRVNTWREENNIPAEVFVLTSYFNFFNNGNSVKDKPKIKASADDHKPQYINFKNPFLVSLFAKLCDKISDGMRIDEMLPASDDLQKFGEKRYVTEFIAQWN